MNQSRGWKMNIFSGLVIAISCQIYWRLILDDFRVSLAVVLLPLFFTTLNKEEDTVVTAAFIAVFVFLFRYFIFRVAGMPVDRVLRNILPSSLYYLAYGLFFKLLIPNKRLTTVNMICLVGFICDFSANMVELFTRGDFFHHRVGMNEIISLLLIAFVRTILVMLSFVLLERYRTLLTKVSLEARYQKLFLMKTGLKSEVYFMKKSMEGIEGAMGNAYRLYEQLSALDIPEDNSKLALMIARDVHEIKKDYFWSIQGIEREVEEDFPVGRMSLHDLFSILQEASYRLIDSEALNIHLKFRYQTDILTDKHYSLIVVLRNLVKNAIESLALSDIAGRIQIRQSKEGDNYIFTVMDNGPGIAEKDLDKIFRIGFSTKFDPDTGNVYRGIGLAGVKAMVEEDLGGRIEVRSVPDQTTEFRIIIPVEVLEGEIDENLYH